MPIDDKDVVWMKPPTIGLLEQLYIPAIVQGLTTTVEHSIKALFGKGQITQQFPEVEPKLPANYRGVHRLNRDEQNRVKCVACYMCSTACPVDAIELTTLYDLTGMSREEMMFDKEKLLSVFDETTKPGAKFYNPVR